MLHGDSHDPGRVFGQSSDEQLSILQLDQQIVSFEGPIITLRNDKEMLATWRGAQN